MNADAMTDEQYRIYKLSNFVDLENLPNDEFEGSKRFEDSNIVNCSSVIASAFIYKNHRGARAHSKTHWCPGASLVFTVSGYVVFLSSINRIAFTGFPFTLY